jgi:hypothetical protein
MSDLLIAKCTKAQPTDPVVSDQGTSFHNAFKAPLCALSRRLIRFAFMEDYERGVFFEICNAGVERSYERIHNNLLCYGKDLMLMQNVRHCVPISGLITEVASVENCRAQCGISFRLSLKHFIASNQHFFWMPRNQCHARRDHPSFAGNCGGRVPRFSSAKAIDLPGAHVFQNKRRR